MLATQSRKQSRLLDFQTTNIMIKWPLLAEPGPALADLPKRTREQLIKRGDDCIAVLGKRPDTLAQMFVSNRDNLHRV